MNKLSRLQVLTRPLTAPFRAITGRARLADAISQTQIAVDALYDMAYRDGWNDRGRELAGTVPQPR